MVLYSQRMSIPCEKQLSLRDLFVLFDRIYSIFYAELVTNELSSAFSQLNLHSSNYTSLINFFC